MVKLDSYLFFCVYWKGGHRDLHVLTHSFPTRRSSDLGNIRVRDRASALPRPFLFARRRFRSRAKHEAPSPHHRVSPGREDAAASRSSRPKNSDRSEEHTSELKSLMLT